MTISNMELKLRGELEAQVNRNVDVLVKYHIRDHMVLFDDVEWTIRLSVMMEENVSH